MKIFLSEYLTLEMNLLNVCDSMAIHITLFNKRDDLVPIGTNELIIKRFW